MHKMEITYDTVKQAQEDYNAYVEYLEEENERHFEERRKSFKEMFGYEIILFEDGTFQFKGIRKNK